MSVAITVQVAGTVDAKLNSIGASLAKRRSLNKALAVRGSLLVRANFAKKESQPNKEGWPKAHFYAQASRSTFYDASDTFARVTIAKLGIRQRLYGGTIKPTKGTYLTIPADARGYNHRAREFSDLVFGYADDGKGHKRKALLQAGQPIYWLVRKVTQAPDRSVLPSDAEFLAAINDQARIEIAKLIGGQP